MLSMTRRARRPSFSPSDQRALFRALADARNWAVRCGSAERHGSPRYAACTAVTDAIDALAEEMTGHREYFWGQAHGSKAPPGTAWSVDHAREDD
jgi:hypothetical protein